MILRKNNIISLLTSFDQLKYALTSFSTKFSKIDQVITTLIFDRVLILRFQLRMLLLVILFAPAMKVKAQFPEDFQRVELLTGLTNSISFEFAPDGRIFLLDRYGELIIYKPDIQTTVTAGTLSVFHDLEDGLLGIAVDPDFSNNNFIYLHYSPASVSVNRVSRFTMDGDMLDLASEVILLEWPTQRDGCCHSAGDLDFDSQGNLYIATGDNTNHSPYAALNENDPVKSAEKSSSNTNDLRGKILRITPLAVGGYTIPSDNLFPDGNGGRPEIYVMGARNPFKIFVDKQNTDWLFWGEVGPDANSPDPNRGPGGYDEINLVKSTGNYGWPYFTGENEAHLIDYTNPTYYNDPNAPVNVSSWNTGASNLPPARPAWMTFKHDCWLAGPRYQYDPELTDQQRMPVEYDGAFFYFDFNRSKIWFATMDTNGDIVENQRFANSVFPNNTESGFIDLKVGPDGHMYILEYGTGCCANNTGTGKLVRVDYIGIVSNSSPIVKINADPTDGSLPLQVNFSSIGTYDPDGDPLSYEWDFNTDGIVDSNLENPSYLYNSGGTFNTQLRVSDGQGGVVTKNITIHAGNNKAMFTFNTPVDGGFFDWNDEVSIELSVQDVEDGSVDCNVVNLVPSLGHLTHFHDDLTIDGCYKTFTLDPVDHDIEGEMDIYYVFNVSYTDNGGLTSFDQFRLHPKRKEAEYYNSQNSVEEIENTDKWGGGSAAIRVGQDSYITLDGRNLKNIQTVKYRVSSLTAGGTIELRLDSIDGELIASATVPKTGSEVNWVDIEAELPVTEGKHDLYFVFDVQNEADHFNLNWIEFTGDGISVDDSQPQVAEVQALSANIVMIKFSEPIETASATRVENYSIDQGIIVESGFLQPDQKTVMLVTSQLNQNVEYHIEVAGTFSFSFTYAGCGSTEFPNQWEAQVIDQELPYRSIYIIPDFDIDGDGFKDIVTGGWWYRNPGSISGTWEQNQIGTPFNNVALIHDFDGDNDPDLFGTTGSFIGADLVWAENNGDGTFIVHDDLPSGTSSYATVFIAGIAGGVYQQGGNYQIAITWNGAENGSSEVQMVTVPNDPVNGNWTIQTIHPTSLGEGLSNGDIDGDGDLDLFQAGNWLRNDGGTWSFFSTGLTLSSKFDRNVLADIDGDGDLDGVVGQFANDQEIAWFESPADPTKDWIKHTIYPTIDGGLSIEVADMDFDGDMDVLVGEWKQGHILFGFENDLNASGDWIKHTLDPGNNLDHHDGVQVADLDNDGDLDIVSIGWNKVIPRIFENKSSSLNSNCSPILVNPGNQEYPENSTVELQIIASDPNPTDQLTYSAIGLPASLMLDSQSGIISGNTGSNEGVYAVTVSVTDGEFIVEESFTITIDQVTELPEDPAARYKVYPNPAQNEIFIEHELIQSQVVDYKVYDLLGQEFDFGSETVESGRTIRKLELNTFQQGVFLLLITSNGKQSVHKIFITR